MTANSMSENLQKAQQQSQQAQQEETKKILETLKNDMQSSLAAELKSFKDSIVAAHSRFHRMQQWALGTVAVASLLSLLIIAASVWEAHRITSQAQFNLTQTEARLLAAEAREIVLQRQIAAIHDPFTELRNQQLIPAGELVHTANGIFIQLKPAK